MSGIKDHRSRSVVGGVGGVVVDHSNNETEIKRKRTWVTVDTILFSQKTIKKITIEGTPISATHRDESESGSSRVLMGY